MSDIYRALSQIKISKRINEASTSFTVTLKTPLDPDEYDTGSTLEYVITDNTLKEGHIAIQGIVETLDTDYTDNNKIWGLGGRDMGRLLVKQGYKLDSVDTETETASTYTVMELLEIILTNTGITIGRGQKQLNKVITLTTDGKAINRYCGSWTTKQDAINQLFAQYIRFSGAKQFKWYIDFAGQFRWFELNSNRGRTTYFFEDDTRIINFKPKKDATGILNDFIGYYGPEEDQTSVHLTSSTSITTYGLCPAEPITETNYTQAEMTERLQRELDQKSVPIYTASLELVGIHHIEPGTQIEFPNNAKYSDITWTVVDWSLNINENAQHTTSLGLSTDQSAISITNEFEAVQSIAKKEVNDAKAMTGIVTSVPTDGSSDRCNVWFSNAGGSGSGAVASVRNVSGDFRFVGT